METTSRPVHVALLSAGLAVALWAAKAVAIGLAGGLNRSPAENPLFLAGLACFLVAAVSLGLALTRGRHLALRVAAGVLGPVLGFALAMAIDTALRGIRPPHPSWVWTELNLWVIAPLALALAVVLARRTA
jgi:hypothetical protein